MKQEDVTLEIASRYQQYLADRATRVGNDKEAMQLIIAAAVNAVLGEPTPITAERLVKMGYRECGTGFYVKDARRLQVRWDGKEVSILCSGLSTLPTKTIGQLVALEIGLGIR